MWTCLVIGMRRKGITANEKVEIEETRQYLHHQAQLQSKDKEKMTDLGGHLADSRKAGRKSYAIMRRSNTALATLASENKLRIAAHLTRSNIVLATLASENKVRTNLCLTMHTYYLHSHLLNPQLPSLNTRFLWK